MNKFDISRPDQCPGCNTFNALNFKVVQVRSGEDVIRETDRDTILILEGKGSYSSEVHEEVDFAGQVALLVPSSTIFIIGAQTDIYMRQIFPGEKFVAELRMFTGEELSRPVPLVYAPSPLRMHPILKKNLETLDHYRGRGVYCGNYFDLQRKQFFQLLSILYTHSELEGFFQPVRHHDPQFLQFIYSNWKGSRRVDRLVAASANSETSFLRRFKSVFGIPPKKWLDSKIARRICYETHTGRKTDEELRELYGFNSLSEMKRFCQKNGGTPPL